MNRETCQEINDYLEWNDALWNYFFSGKEEVPILYLDSYILREIAIKEKIKLSENGQDDHFVYEADFLKKVFLDKCAVKNFSSDWHIKTGQKIILKNWVGLVNFLINYEINEKVNINTPVFFGVLCGSILLASKNDCQINRIKEDIEIRVKSKINIRSLLESILKKIKSKVSIGTKETHIPNWLKLQCVLSNPQREKLINILKENKVNWNDEYLDTTSDLYSNFVQNSLIPLLPTDFHFLVQANGSIYKPVLLSILRDLSIPNSKNSVIKQKATPISWKYRLEFDEEGKPIFSIYLADSISPCKIDIENHSFTPRKRTSPESFVKTLDKFELFKPVDFSKGGKDYKIENIAKRARTIFLICVGDDIFEQVKNPINNGHYVLITEKKNKDKYLAEEWDDPRINLGPEDYIILEKEHYQKKEKIATTSKKHSYQFNNIGNWFSLALQENDKVFWAPVCVNEVKLIEIETKESSNLHYFKLNYQGQNTIYIKGTLYVTSQENFCLNELNSKSTYNFKKNINQNFQWDGIKYTYELNGWGECVAVNKRKGSHNKTTEEQINNSISIQNDSGPSLLEVLYAIADENGCIDQPTYVDALNYILNYHGVVPNMEIRNNISYSLNSLGYMSSFFDSSKNMYINQLQPAYLAPTLYKSKEKIVYIVKGVYSNSQLENLRKKVQLLSMRPYQDDQEIWEGAICLPDTYYFAITKEEKKELEKSWIINKKPDFKTYIEKMENMNNFAEHFLKDNNGDPINNQSDMPLPYCRKDGDNYSLFVEEDNRIVKRITYKLKRYVNKQPRNEFFPSEIIKLYCNGQQRLPLCLKSDTEILFTRDMGIHRLVDRALCDLSASIPQYKHIILKGKTLKVKKYTIGKNNVDFSPMYQKMAGCNDSYAWSTALFSNPVNTCKSLITNTQKLKEALRRKNEHQKTSDFYVPDEVQLKNRLTNFRLYCSHSTDKRQIIMAINNGLKAFVIGKTAAYAKARNSKKFRQIVNGNPLQLFTAYIQGKELVYGEYYEGELPQIDEKVQEIEFVLIKDNDNN